MSNVVTEDDEPVDNFFSEREQKLLGDTLETAWRPGVPFLALANVGLFYGEGRKAIVPDFMLALDVTAPPDVWEKGNRSYVVWRYAKPPDLVIEIVSGGEDQDKQAIYESIRVPYYVIHDPCGALSRRAVRVFELRGARYVEVLDPYAVFEPLGLKLTLWDGVYQQLRAVGWLRWRDADGVLLPTGRELAEQERERADQERERADQERERADQERERASQERERAEQLARKLRELGYDPD